MHRKYNILMLGASYGSLLGAKMLYAGHDVTLVCLPAEADLINSEGFRVRLPVRDAKRDVELDTRNASGRVRASSAADADPARYDLIVLAMQEPQYASAGVRGLTGLPSALTRSGADSPSGRPFGLMQRVAASRVPCMSIMNMPPLAYLARIPTIDTRTLRDSYTDASVWDAFDPSLITLCSPDPQAFRPPGEPVNVLQVSLPTNFKAARFPSDEHTAMLHDLERDIDALRFSTDDGDVELPVKLRVHESVFVPLAKWSMLIAGNYRCVQPTQMQSIRDAVHGDLAASRRIYDFVGDVCKTLGASADDLVPFDKYANAARGLAKPSSAARALAAGAVNIERVDRLVKTIASQHGLANATLDQVVARVDDWLARNRSRQAEKTPA